MINQGSSSEVTIKGLAGDRVLQVVGYEAGVSL